MALLFIQSNWFYTHAYPLGYSNWTIIFPLSDVTTSMRAGYYLIIHLIFKFNLIIKFTIETILKCVKNKVYNSLFVRKAFMLVYKLQDKLSPQTNEKYSFQY